MLSIPERKGPFGLLEPHGVAAATRAGIPIHVWTIDDPATAQRLWDAGATGIITNVPDKILAQRSRSHPA
jgi:glycerophosphoryl diester phosphodiesterase